MFTLNILLLNLVSTFFMTGIAWFVQIVHYPLFKLCANENFPYYSQLHSKYSGYVVTVPMLIEFVTSAMLLVWYPSNISFYYFVAGYILVLIIWLSTFLLQVPAHGLLSKGYSPEIIDYLVKTNWIRTIAWSLRTFLLTYIIYRFLL